MDSDTVRRAHELGNPLITETTVTWIWEGADPPLLAGDFTSWTEGLPARSIRPGIWQYQIELPDDAYVEYAFFDRIGDDASRRPDPLARSRVPNGLGHWNHPVRMPLRPASPRRRPGCPRGKITKHTIEDRFIVAGGRRDVWLYEPASHDGSLPVLVVYDGNDYLRRAAITAAADMVIDDASARPFAMALVAHARRARFTEYCAGEAVLAMLESLVLPLVANQNHRRLGEWPRRSRGVDGRPPGAPHRAAVAGTLHNGADTGRSHRTPVLERVPDPRRCTPRRWGA